ncbi:MAG: hypothetical protein EZS28_037706 [Streblomastix strix]|uniref:Uncharacterized protein n=1 Tax=Streblomastix strix TaxID=222440 RepID=A0A5J4U8A7_9EUKA|nr:MAG: hypothetical protein EZS28_037706 [Streblomastix strix]
MSVNEDSEIEVFKQTGNSSGVNGTKINEKLLSERDCNDHQHGQCGNGVEHQVVESKKTDVVIDEKDPISDDGYGFAATNTTHSGSKEQSSGSTEQDFNEGRQLDQTGSTGRSTKPVKTCVWLDAYATRMNKLLPKNCSLCPDRGQLKVSTLCLSWQNLNPYQYAPVNQILKALVKTIERELSSRRGSRAGGGVPGDGLSDDGSESISPTRMDESCKIDKHKAGEELFRGLFWRVMFD